MRNETDRLLEKYMDLQKELGYYEKILHNTDAIILILDMLTPRILFANEAFQRVTGYKIQEGKDISFEDIISLYHPDDKAYFTEMQNHLITKPESNYNAFYRIRKPDGSYIWLYTSNRVFRVDPENEVFEVIATSLNFSAPIHFQKNLKHFTQNKLQYVNKGTVDKISKREKEVLKEFARGSTTHKVAEKLGISHHTVNNHRKNMLRKLNLNNLAALISFAVENGLD